MGASSGGYGALHHISEKNTPFSVAMAIAPDSAFEISLLPDVYKTSETLKTISSVNDLRTKIADSRFRDSKIFFPALNSAAMSLCYSDTAGGVIEYPVDLETGEIREDVFKKWQERSSAFLKHRVSNLKEASLYLSVGRFDEHALYFGARRVRDVLSAHNIPHEYREFDGGHYKTMPQKSRLSNGSRPSGRNRETCSRANPVCRCNSLFITRCCVER